MANPEHLAILKRGVQEWNAWRTEHKAVRPDLSAADLRQGDLTSADFRWADLREANLQLTGLSGACFQGASLFGANLGGSDLAHASLVAAHLRVAILERADLSQADLTGATLVRARLSQAHLRGAHLNEADLGWADLRRADMSASFLFSSNLSGADLSRANMQGALLWNTTFANCNLLAVTGLADCRHGGPSTLDYQTIVRSQELPPLPFLRGVGLPDWLIDTYRGYVGSPIEFYSCFISYNHTDQPFARRLHDQLQAKGIRCWLDEHRLKPGDDIYEGVDRGIRLWDKVLLCCSEAALSSWWIEREADTAIEKERQLHEKHDEPKLALIPLNLDGSMFGWKGKHAATLRGRLAADFTGWESNNSKFEAQFERVVEALRADEQAGSGLASD